MSFFLTNRPLHLYIQSISSHSRIRSHSIKLYILKVLESKARYCKIVFFICLVETSCCPMSNTDDESVIVQL